MLLRITIIAAVVVLYFIAAWFHSRDHTRNSVVRDVFFAPAFFFGFAIFLPVGCIFFWLYPERHVRDIDIDGTEEERALLETYRTELGKKQFLLRVAEKLKLKVPKDPPRPFG